MERLTDDELRRIRLAGSIARGCRYFLYVVMVFLVLLVAAGLYITCSGVEIPSGPNLFFLGD